MFKNASATCARMLPLLFLVLGCVVAPSHGFGAMYVEEKSGGCPPEFDPIDNAADCKAAAKFVNLPSSDVYKYTSKVGLLLRRTTRRTDSQDGTV